MSESYRNGIVYSTLPEVVERFWAHVFKPNDIKRELPVFGLPGIRYRALDGAELYHWSMKFKEPFR